MTTPTHADAEKVTRSISIQALQRRAIVHAYVQGFQDAEAEKVIAGPRDLENRTDDLFEQYLDRLEDAEVPFDGH